MNYRYLYMIFMIVSSFSAVFGMQTSHMCPNMNAILKGINLEVADPEELLFVAVENCNIQLVKELIAQGARVQTYLLGWSPFLCAVAYGQKNIVQTLIEAGAPVDDCLVSPMRESAYQIAKYNGYNELASLLKSYQDIKDLVSKADISYEEIRLGINQSNLKRVIDLLNTKKLYINARYYTWNRTLLHYSATSGNLSMVKVLMKAGANVNAEDTFGLTPLNYAAQAKKENVISYLLSKNADITIALAILERLQYGAPGLFDEGLELLKKVSKQSKAKL